MTALDFATRRFQSAAAHYLAGRTPYPEALIANVARLLELLSTDRILDLGCGPAQLATAFAPFAGEVLALDPEPHMLALAREATNGLPNVKVAEGSSDDLGPEFGRFRAVLIGRAFHWMDREETLKRLDRLIEPDGAVVLFGDGRPAIPENKWVKEVEALLERYSEDDEGRRHRRSDAFAPHISVLLRSPFNRLQQFGVTAERELTIDGLVDRALSRSSTSRARLGERVDVMIEELRALAAELSSSGPLLEVVTSNALIARRP
ncbi:class I SAM-dependent methyltransferase [Mesorhizobium sp. BAC0120]|uniref:class I SAM-dependent methyltransferase n=1 Tax=Mesorhizobium sp. BAC0120 TaxID=3090670 RepID=UPI00298D35F9|nr:class I SAM-dependent methyltransferase [Mesorhizobium sp. BAC0120]MDW6025407.1 class I SAM-dependent methyltransferase [Mesorhizobium sp. BAC0120]